MDDGVPPPRPIEKVKSYPEMSVPVPTCFEKKWWVGQISGKFRSLSFGGVETKKLRTIYYNQVVFMILGMEIYFMIVLIFRAFHVCEISMDQVTILNDFFHGSLSIFHNFSELAREQSPSGRPATGSNGAAM